MERERFDGNWDLVYTIILGFLALATIGYFERGFDRISLYGFAAGVLATLWTLQGAINTYLELQEKRFLVNKGFKEFGHDKIDIYNIKYIYRAAAFPMKSWGSLMTFFIVDPDTGKLKHSTLRETNYSDQTLKEFLSRIKELNPNIELDEQYQEFLNGKYDDQRFVKTVIFSGVHATKNTQEVEKLLEEKEERW